MCFTQLQFHGTTALVWNPCLPIGRRRWHRWWTEVSLVWVLFSLSSPSCSSSGWTRTRVSHGCNFNGRWTRGVRHSRYSSWFSLPFIVSLSVTLTFFSSPLFVTRTASITESCKVGDMTKDHETTKLFTPSSTFFSSETEKKEESRLIEWKNYPPRTTIWLERKSE